MLSRAQKKLSKKLGTPLFWTILELAELSGCENQFEVISFYK
jgi:hypothetical protein